MVRTGRFADQWHLAADGAVGECGGQAVNQESESETEVSGYGEDPAIFQVRWIRCGLP